MVHFIFRVLDVAFKNKARYIFIIFLSVCFLGFVDLPQGKPVESRGGKVKVVKYNDGSWQLLVGQKPYFIKGVMFSPVKIGEDPGNATMRDWMYYDDNKDGINDVAFQSWVDKNGNNKRDADEPRVGDFQLLKELGVNTIRLYNAASSNPILGDIYKNNPSTALQHDHPINKDLLRKLYKNYGIMVIMGNFIGSWTIGSGASWEEGTDYNNPRHRENIKKAVKAMVLDNKDEPYVLIWMLGNENNVADWSRCNAKSSPEAYAKLIGELAQMIHSIDPEHPVAVCDGDNFNTLPLYAKYASGIDIIAFNSYRGASGFGNIWKTCRRVFDRPVFISEFGSPAYNVNTGEDQDYQANYIKGCWQDIVRNSSYYHGEDKKDTANSIGGVVFDWVDRWYMDGTSFEHNPGTQYFNSPDNLRHEEWFGIVSVGDGSEWLMRQERKAYNYLKSTWNKESISY